MGEGPKDSPEAPSQKRIVARPQKLASSDGRPILARPGRHLTADAHSPSFDTAWTQPSRLYSFDRLPRAAGQLHESRVASSAHLRKADVGCNGWSIQSELFRAKRPGHVPHSYRALRAASAEPAGLHRRCGTSLARNAATTKSARRGDLGSLHFQVPQTRATKQRSEVSRLAVQGQNLVVEHCHKAWERHALGRGDVLKHAPEHHLDPDRS